MRTAAGRAFPNEVASAVNMSANYFSAIFSQKDAEDVCGILTGKRMERAKKLLRETDKSSGEIAQEVGYKDPHYFSYVFKKILGAVQGNTEVKGSIFQNVILFGGSDMQLRTSPRREREYILIFVCNHLGSHL